MMVYMENKVVFMFCVLINSFCVCQIHLKIMTNKIV